MACGSTCSASFSSGTSVTLTATPTAGSSFSGWSGACSGTGSCNVAMTAAQAVTTTFTGPLLLKGDFNGDGKADLVWQNTATGTVDLWYMNGGQVISDALVVSGVTPDQKIVGPK
ncbi:MAG TPA: hypothetical protein VEU07_14050 [Candidatus Acidoferrum sp.]|nr:hypothetical protein [Candidatus Acidoferrum sp.]